MMNEMIGYGDMMIYNIIIVELDDLFFFFFNRCHFFF
jgi:hypothetical protein